MAQEFRDPPTKEQEEPKTLGEGNKVDTLTQSEELSSSNEDSSEDEEAQEQNKKN